MSAKEIATRLNESGYRYCGQSARGWDGESLSRIYYGKSYVTLERDGEIHNRRAGKARALTIGHEAVEAVKSVAAGLVAAGQYDDVNDGSDS